MNDKALLNYAAERAVPAALSLGDCIEAGTQLNLILPLLWSASFTQSVFQL